MQLSASEGKKTLKETYGESENRMWEDGDEAK